MSELESNRHRRTGGHRAEVAFVDCPSCGQPGAAVSDGKFAHEACGAFWRPLYEPPLSPRERFRARHVLDDV
jgi:hypothetical protein